MDEFLDWLEFNKDVLTINLENIRLCKFTEISVRMNFLVGGGGGAVTFERFSL